ncbi:WG repeat-containing protein [Larkinella sp. VNQ87]|uniref:WG repeat-containing protein n=1 Tax=Larkinella sp. VNQ87 TaxID=3400921 RepID=UPI003C031F85
MIDTIRQKIQEVLVRYDHQVPAEEIKRLFASIPSDETTLTQEIMGYLLEHHYEPLQSLRGESQRERLVSTDWRQKEAGLWMSEAKPAVMGGGANVSVHPIPTPFTQSNKVLITLVMLFVTVLLWLWNSKLSEIGSGSGVVESTESESGPAERPAANPDRATPAVANLARPETVLPMTTKPAGSQTAYEAQTIQTKTRAGQLVVSGKEEITEPLVAETTKPFDAVDDQVGDFGLRAARKGGKWGYVDQKDQWQINPLFDDVMPFHNGRAIVILDGQQILIDRDGTRIREDN